MASKKQFENNGYIDPNDTTNGINKGQEFLETDALFADDINKVVSNQVHFQDSILVHDENINDINDYIENIDNKIDVINKDINDINDSIEEIDNKIEALDIEDISSKIESLKVVSVVTNASGIPGQGEFPNNPKVGDVVLRALQYLYGSPNSVRMSVYEYNGTDWVERITIPNIFNKFLLDYTTANLNVGDTVAWEAGISGPLPPEITAPDGFGTKVFAQWDGTQWKSKMIIPKEPTKLHTFAIVSTNSTNNFCIATLPVPKDTDALQWFKDLVSGNRPIQVSGSVSGNSVVGVSNYIEATSTITLRLATGQTSTFPIYGIQELNY